MCTLKNSERERDIERERKCKSAKCKACLCFSGHSGAHLTGGWTKVKWKSVLKACYCKPTGVCSDDPVLWGWMDGLVQLSSLANPPTHVFSSIIQKSLRIPQHPFGLTSLSKSQTNNTLSLSLSLFFYFSRSSSLFLFLPSISLFLSPDHRHIFSARCAWPFLHRVW